jgi:Ca-activated chloride channel family protein
MWRRLSVLPLLLALGAWEPLRSPDPDVEAGNRAYAAGKWQEAIEHYERARGSGVDEAGLDYNLGSAKLKLGASLGGAEKDRLTTEGLADLERVRKSKNTEMRAEASFNAGNAQLANEKFEQAIESYKQSLRDNPEYADARANLELALRKLQKQQEQQGQGQGQGQPPPQGGQGQGQPPPQGGQGQGQPPPQGGQGSGQGQPPQQPPQNPDGTEQDLPPDNPPPAPNGSGGSGQPKDPPPDPSGGSSQPPPDAGSNSGSNDGSAQPPKDPPQGSGSPQKHGLPSRHRDPSDDGPRTDDDDRLEDLEKGSRDLRRGQVRGGNATGRDDGAVDW